MIKIPVKLLIVDDEEDFAQMFSLRLKRQGEIVFTAFSGEAALALLEEEAIEVVFLDIKMPGMDGIQTLKAIKARHPLVEVILLTGHGSAETAVAGMNSGAFDYLMKPADFDEIKDKLANAQKRRYEQEERIRRAEARLLLRRSGDV